MGRISSTCVEERQRRSVPEGTLIATCYLVSLMGLDQAIMKWLLDMLTEETVTVEVPSTGDDAQDKFTSECVKQVLQMTSPSSRWWDATMRVTMFVPYFGAERRVGNLSLAHCAAAVGSVELLHKSVSIGEMSTGAAFSLLHAASAFGHSLYFPDLALQMNTNAFECQLTQLDEWSCSIMHYAASNGHSWVLATSLSHYPISSALLHHCDSRGCPPIVSAVVGRRLGVLSLLLPLCSDQSIHFCSESGYFVTTSLCHFACEYGFTSAIHALAEARYGLSMINSDGRTPAMLAAFFGFKDTLEALHERGANMEGVEETALCCSDFTILAYLSSAGLLQTTAGRKALQNKLKQQASAKALPVFKAPRYFESSPSVQLPITKEEAPPTVYVCQWCFHQLVAAVAYARALHPDASAHHGRLQSPPPQADCSSAMDITAEAIVEATQLAFKSFGELTDALSGLAEVPSALRTYWPPIMRAADVAEESVRHLLRDNNNIARTYKMRCQQARLLFPQLSERASSASVAAYVEEQVRTVRDAWKDSVELGEAGMTTH